VRRLLVGSGQGIGAAHGELAARDPRHARGTRSRSARLQKGHEGDGRERSHGPMVVLPAEASPWMQIEIEVEAVIEKA
jgi:hypothetical protein